MAGGSRGHGFHEEAGSMMKSRIAVGASLTAALLVGSVIAAEALKSGPAVGQPIPGPFTPLNVTGKFAGTRQCLVEANGGNPVVMIFAREVSDPLTSLVKKIDAATARNRSSRMGSFVVFCSDDEGLEAQLKDLARKEDLTNIVLTIDRPTGPKHYNIARDADVTVVLYTRQTVKVNYAFKKGQWKYKEIDKIVADVKKILPEDR
jgi:hypothetical protein